MGSIMKGVSSIAGGAKKGVSSIAGGAKKGGNEPNARQNARTGRVKARTAKREQRKNARADRIATRKGFESGDKGTAREQGRAFMADRATKRKQNLRNFASHLATAEQSKRAPRFGEGPGNAGYGKGVFDYVTAQREKEASDASDIANQVTTTVANEGLKKNADTTTSADPGVSGVMKIDNPDSSPSAFMKKEYMKKRGF
jgi:hypothetical protein